MRGFRTKKIFVGGLTYTTTEGKLLLLLLLLLLDEHEAPLEDWCLLERARYPRTTECR